MRLRLARRALADAKRKKTWWQRNRPDAPDLFEQELNATLERIAAAPAIGQRVEQRGARASCSAPATTACTVETVTWWRSLAALLCIVTALVSSRDASASSRVQAENRVRGFDLVAPARTATN